MKARKGFTLVEVVACTIILATVTLGAVSISSRINAMKVESKNTTYLSLHNLNVMEELRQRVYDLSLGEEMPAFYDSSEFSSSDITTTVSLDMSYLDQYRVYDVVIESRAANKQKLKSRYVLTDIGSPHYDGLLEGDEDVVPVLDG